MAEKISRDDLGNLLLQNLEGTALEPMARNHSYVTGPDGFVDPKVIGRLMGIFQQAIDILQMPTPRRKKNVTEEVDKIRKAIESIRKFGNEAG